MERVEFKKEYFVANRFDFSKGLYNGFEILSFAPIFKKEVREDMANLTLIQSYSKAAAVIAAEIDRSAAGQYSRNLTVNPLTLPFFQLIRHTIELSMKFMHKLIKGKSVDNPNHNLLSLWKEIKPDILKMEIDTQGFNTSEWIEGFIQIIDEIDPDGAHSKYIEDKNHKKYDYVDKPMLINVRAINGFVKASFISFVEQIEKNVSESFSKK